MLKDFFKIGKNDPSRDENIKRITPSRYYVREEVLHIRSLLWGVVVDGLKIQELGEIEEKDLWWQFEVSYVNGTAEMLYFFKGERTSGGID